jgi:hypothetical protein
LCFVQKHNGSAAALAMKALICAGASARMVHSLVSGGPRSVGAFRAVVKWALTGKTPPHND